MTLPCQIPDTHGELRRNQYDLDLRLELVEQAVEIFSKMVVEAKERENSLRKANSEPVGEEAADSSVRRRPAASIRGALLDGESSGSDVPPLHDAASGETGEPLA